VEEQETRAAKMVIIQPNQTRRILYLFTVEQETREAEMVIIQPNLTSEIIYLFSCGGGGD